MPAFVEYSLDNKIAVFFNKTSATREACDERAASLLGGPISPAAIQGDCSYTVYGGHDFQFVVQFRHQSQSLRLQTVALARDIHGYLAPTTTYRGQLGENASQETVSVYCLDRIPGISYIEFLLADTHGQDAEENVVLRVGLMTDLAR